MPMDPLDPYVQLIMGAPPSPDYIPGPEAPPSPDYIPGPKAPPSPDYIPGPEYPDEEEEEEHLALTVPAPAQYSSVSEFDETEPFEEGETAATPPLFGYRIAAKISVQPHILMPFRSESEIDRLLAIPTPPLSPKRARFTTPTRRYEIGESSVAAAARQIRPTLTIAESRRLMSREVHTSTLVTQMEALRREVSTLQRQRAQRDIAPEDGDSCS
nr:hypothetical protein [Tanacetum cinerariifolium]